MEVLIGVVVGVALGLGGFWLGLGRGKSVADEQAKGELERRVAPLIAALERGRVPAGLTPGSPEAGLKKALERGWAPRDAERQAALSEAIGRVSSFLQSNVRAPLAGSDEGADAGADAAELRERIGRALGALEDLEFFVSEPSAAREGTDLVSLAQKVSREFVADQAVGVRLGLSGPGVRASVNPQALMDALYLVLHNAGRFGAGQTIDLGVEEANGRAKITVRDRGSGFTEEAFRRAFDPFYSTSDEGLGLGLPHARKVVEAMGGTVELRNMPTGGAEVELSFPSA